MAMGFRLYSTFQRLRVSSRCCTLCETVYGVKGQYLWGLEPASSTRSFCTKMVQKSFRGGKRSDFFPGLVFSGCAEAHRLARVAIWRFVCAGDASGVKNPAGGRVFGLAVVGLMLGAGVHHARRVQYSFMTLIIRSVRVTPSASALFVHVARSADDTRPDSLPSLTLSDFAALLFSAYAL